MYYSSQDHDTLREDHQIPSTSTSGMTSATLIFIVSIIVSITPLNIIIGQSRIQLKHAELIACVSDYLH